MEARVTSSCREKCRESRRACHSGLHCWVNWCVMTRTSSRAPIPSGSKYVVGNRYPSALGASAGTPTLTSKLESSAAARKESRGILSWARARSATSASRRPSRTVKRCSTPRPRSSAATTSDQDSSCRSRYTPLLSEPASPRSRAYSRKLPGWAITWLAASESTAASRVAPGGIVTVTRGPAELPQAASAPTSRMRNAEWGMKNQCGMRNSECGIAGQRRSPHACSAARRSPGPFRLPHSAFRIRFIPHSALSQRGAPFRIQIVLQQHRRRERIHVVLAAPGRPAHCAHGPERTRRGEPLVPQLDGLSRAACDVVGERPRGGGGFRLGPVLVERQADHDARHGAPLEQGEELAHREAFAGAAGGGGPGVGGGGRVIWEGGGGGALPPRPPQQPGPPAPP